MTDVEPDDQLLLRRLGRTAEEAASDDAERVRAVDRELARGFAALAGVERAVSVFGSARTPPGHPDYLLATEVARALGNAGYAIITGAGPGIMEAANRGAREAEVRSIGCNIRLPHEQDVNPFVDLRIDFDHFFARKVMFVRYASAFIIHPGGFGTMDELFESLNLITTATIRHFPVVLVGSDHWQGLLAWMDHHMVGSGEIEPAEAGLLRVSDDPAEVVAIIEGAAGPRLAEGEI
ncbi:MAG: TIGR00730 family Rossman fold protein [Solirubrobacterales bacterium]